jgi:Predicted pyridoxal phosphate-dependent enzyme apparently involved in regulation of cell wall biogenesis
MKDLKKRNEIALRYNEAFKDSKDIGTPKVDSNSYHAYHLYIIKIKDRLGLYNYLRKNNIFAQVHYVPLHLMPYYKDLGNKKGDLPVVEEYYEECLSLPMYPTLTTEEQEYVINTVLNFFRK